LAAGHALADDFGVLVDPDVGGGCAEHAGEGLAEHHGK
jgi:hypothetical protein